MSTANLLLLDCGNSAVKCQRVHVSAEQLDRPRTLFEQLRAAPIERMDNAEVSVERLLAAWRSLGLPESAGPLRLSWVSVGPQSIVQAVRVAFKQVSGCDAPDPWQPSAQVEFTQLNLAYFKNTYTHAEQLGADRWVSALGLACQSVIAPGETHMVVSAGTATTVDLIRADANQNIVFLGGWILPGIGLMNEALRVKTRDLDGLMGESTELPINTDAAIPTDSRTAISQGIGLAQAGFIGQIAKQHHVTKLWLHGGDATQWRAYLSALHSASVVSLTVHDAPHLAFAGLLALERYRILR
ncbi:MAG: type III pantothenate kinase [Burkholderiaceae bacterium]|nr:type III pantothenate kinase [Burkholderiaceae bacterium]